LQTHLQKVTYLTKVLEDFYPTQTATTEELRLQTLCNSDITYLTERPQKGLFFCAYIIYEIMC